MKASKQDHLTNRVINDVGGTKKSLAQRCDVTVQTVINWQKSNNMPASCIEKLGFDVIRKESK